MAAMDPEYVSGNAGYASFFYHFRENTYSTECDQFCFRNTSDPSDAFEAE